jgi:hypothetical protein
VLTNLRNFIFNMATGQYEEIDVDEWHAAEVHSFDETEIH